MTSPPRPLGTIRELLGALDPAQQPELVGCELDTAIGRPRDDSRRVEAGDCFVATTGQAADAHRFVDLAIEAGAGLVLIQRDAQIRGDSPRVIVEDTRRVLAVLAAGWHGWPGDHMKLAGITGTNGKTSASQLVSDILRHAGHPHLRLGTTGNWIVDEERPSAFTTALVVELQELLAEGRRRGASHGVMEVSSHGLDQGRVAQLRFDAVALTSFSQDHLDYHGTMAAYLEAKCRLAREHVRPDGVAIAPVEQGEAAQRFLAAAAEAGVARRWRCSRVATSEDAAQIAVVSRDRSAPGLAARVRTPAGELELRSPLVGEFNLDNLLVTIGLSLGLGLAIEHIEAALAASVGAPGRLEPVAVPGVEGPAVYVDYAHTPDAVARALEALRPQAQRRGGQLVVLLGCGGDRDASKRPLMGEIASRMADRLFASSDNPRTEDPAAILDQMLAGVTGDGAEVIRELDRAQAIAQAIESADARDVVLLAGKGHEDYQILGTTKIHFDDREHAALALQRRAPHAKA